MLKIILLLQILIFYLLPLIMPDPFVLVFLLLLLTFILAILIGLKIKTKIKYLYPIIVAIIFLPSIFLYYNLSALIHSLWYLVIAYLGLINGIIISKQKNI